MLPNRFHLNSNGTQKQSIQQPRNRMVCFKTSANRKNQPVHWYSARISPTVTNLIDSLPMLIIKCNCVSRSWTIVSDLLDLLIKFYLYGLITLWFLGSGSNLSVSNCVIVHDTVQICLVSENSCSNARKLPNQMSV